MERKYRVWDKEKKRFITPVIMDVEEIEITLDMLGNVLYRFPWESGYATVIGNEIFDIQFSTGLKDKNGVEIFEGDFLMAGDAYLGVIKYHSTRAQFIGKNIGETFQEDEYDTLYTKNGRFNSAKVIGNVYENPELLKEESK